MRRFPSVSRVWTALALIALIILAMNLAGCKRKVPPAKVALQVQLSSEPVSIDPSLAEDGIGLLIVGNLMDGLLCHDGSGELQNCLAETVEVSPDQRRYTFKLRLTAMWSDGRPVQVQDFITGMRRALNPQTGSKMARFLYPIRGAEAYHQGKAGPDALGIREEAGKLVIDLEKPVSYFKEVLALSVAMPLREDILQANGGRWPWLAPVTGPYKIGHHRTNQDILLDPNGEYWGFQIRRELKYRPVMLRIVSDEATALSLFESGGLDILTRVPAYDLARMKAKGVVRVNPYLATYYLSFNTRKAPFNDPAWRRAVSGAIDREKICQALTGSEKTSAGSAEELSEIPARGFVPKGLEGYRPYQSPAPLFRDAVASVSKKAPKSPPVVAGFDTSGRNSLVMEKVQSDLKTALGLNVRLSNQEWKSHIKSLETDPPAIYRFAWLAPFADPITHLQVFTTGSPNNYSGWSNAEYDRLVEEIGATAPGAEREKKIARAQEILVDREAAVVPLYHYIQTHLISSRISKFQVSPSGLIRFDEIEVK